MNDDLAMFTDMNDALTALAHALGGFKKVGLALRPELQTKPESAAQWLRDCLNAEKRDKLDPEQFMHLLRLARASGYHAAKHWMDDELGYEQGAPLSEPDQMAKLMRRQEQMVSEFKVLADRMERLTRSPVQMVFGARREGGGNG